jgi:hypothetical protein
LDSEDEEEEPETAESKGKYKIPKMQKQGVWSDQDLEIFRKNWPQLRNFSDNILKGASLKDLQGMGKNKLSHTKVLGSQMTENFELIQNFPVQVEAGPDDCVSKPHSARFLRGFVGDGQLLWIHAREELGPEGLVPIKNYQMTSLGIGDMLTLKVWCEVHKPNSMLLSVRMLSRKSVLETRRCPEKAEGPKEFESLQEFKMAMVTLESAIFRAMPWNMAFRTLHTFLQANDFGSSELGGRSARLTLLADFVDEILQLNAANWEEKKVYLSNPDLVSRWSTFLNRNQLLVKNNESGTRKKEGDRKGNGGKPPRIPAWLCKKFNAGDCSVKEEKHPSSWDPTFILKHACSKITDQGKVCMKNHSEIEHK